MELSRPSPEDFARAQGLRYVSDQEPGYTRRRAGKGFLYRDHREQKVTCEKTLARIRSLVIPPAWSEVWICRLGNGHLQATGRDQRRRKQYRYHPDWSKTRNENKFQKLQAFGRALPKIRRRLRQDLALNDLSRNHILAAVVKTMELTRLRVGNEIYSKQNKSYGLTTIRNHHVKVVGDQVRFYFRGKSEVLRDVSFSDPRLSRIIRQCQELPGAELFAYRGADGKIHDVGSQDVNDYLREISGEEITAKDFRTWGGTLGALEILCQQGPLQETTQVARKRRELEVIKAVSQALGNTVAVCRKYYVDPRVFEADREGHLHQRRTTRKRAGYRSSELQLLALF